MQIGRPDGVDVSNPLRWECVRDGASREVDQAQDDGVRCAVRRYLGIAQ